jgi:hypothetical protein
MADLTPREVEALREALDDEHRAWAIYDQVVRDFGEVAPFGRIREAEARHVAALTALFERHGLAAPENRWPGRVPRYASVREACRAGVQAEIDNAALYDRLLASTDRPELLAVFRNLQEASQERHLEAFRRCADRPSGGGRGGGGRGRRWRGGR